MIVLLALKAEIPILLMRRSQSGASSTGDTGAIGSVLGTGGEALVALGAGSNVSDGSVFDGGSGSGAGVGGSARLTSSGSGAGVGGSARLTSSGSGAGVGGSARLTS
jgi:hypothetical protein